MNRPMKSCLMLAATALLTAVSGCVEREEKIEVREDGSISIQVEFTANSRNELYPGRIPSRQDGWTIEESTRTEREERGGELYEIEKCLLIAKKDFLPLDPSMETYAASNDEEKDLYLQFPTTVKKEHRLDGTYYQFRRIYIARPWAHIEMLQQMVGGEWILKMLKKDPKEMTTDERIRFIRIMVRVEALKMLAFAKAAFEELTPELPQDGWLKVRAGVLEILQNVNCVRIAHLLTEASPEKENALAREAALFEQLSFDRLTMGLSNYCGYNGDTCRAFIELYKRHERFHEITEDLGAEGFKITVLMPGEIVGTNADAIEGNSVTWTFNGKMLRDRRHELMVSSRIGN